MFQNASDLSDQRQFTISIIIIIMMMMLVGTPVSARKPEVLSVKWQRFLDQLGHCLC